MSVLQFWQEKGGFRTWEAWLREYQLEWSLEPRGKERLAVRDAGQVNREGFGSGAKA